MMMAQSRAESTRDTYNYGQYLNQFPPNTIKVIREFEQIQKKICRHKMSIMFNEICINEEMLPIYIYIYIYIWGGICLPNSTNEQDVTQGQFFKRSLTCPVSWVCRIHRPHLCTGVIPPPNECPGYDTKQSNAEVPMMLELWRMRSTPSLLPGPLWPRMVASDRALSIG